MIAVLYLQRELEGKYFVFQKVTYFFQNNILKNVEYYSELIELIVIHIY